MDEKANLETLTTVAEAIENATVALFALKHAKEDSHIAGAARRAVLDSLSFASETLAYMNIGVSKTVKEPLVGDPAGVVCEKRKKFDISNAITRFDREVEQAMREASRLPLRWNQPAAGSDEDMARLAKNATHYGDLHPDAKAWFDRKVGERMDDGQTEGQATTGVVNEFGLWNLERVGY